MKSKFVMSISVSMADVLPPLPCFVGIMLMLFAQPLFVLSGTG